MVSRLWPCLLIALNALAQASVKLELRVDANGSGQAVITNLKSSPMTAYLMQIFLEPCGPFQHRAPVFRAFDAALSGEPLRHLKSRTEILGAAFCNKDGVSVPAKAELKAVVFQDGSSSGEVDGLLNNRRIQLRQFEIVLDRLKLREARKMPREALAEDLSQRLTQAEKHSTFSFPPLLHVSEMASENLKFGIDPTVSLFERLRAKLLEARPAIR